MKNRPANLTDFSGRMAIPVSASSSARSDDGSTAAFCRVDLACVHLGLPGVGPRHCGLEVHEPNGITYYHVVAETMGFNLQDRCVFDTGRIDPPGPDWWYIVATWSDPTGSLCSCIRQKAATLVAAKLPYTPIPDNVICDGVMVGTCNSNYSTHCLMSACGIDHDFGGLFGAPIGWDHRIKKCIRFERTGGCCRCVETKEVDGEWCDPAPKNPNVASGRTSQLSLRQLCAYIGLFAVYFAIFRASPGVAGWFAFLPMTGVYLIHVREVSGATFWGHLYMSSCLGGASGCLLTLLLGFVCGDIKSVFGVVLIMAVVTPVAFLEAMACSAGIMIARVVVHRARISEPLDREQGTKPQAEQPVQRKGEP